MTRFYSIPVLLLMLVCTYSCHNIKNVQNEDPVARVMDNYLYPSDLKGLMPPNLPLDDSIRIARRLIEEWSRNKLLLYQAEINLPEEQKEIEKQVEEYRSSLLIYKYKQLLMTENLNNSISDEEIEAYYRENFSNYILDTDLVQINYLKVPVSAPQISQVRRWYRSTREDYLLNLKEYAAEYAAHYTIDDSTWMYFSDLVEQVPLNIENPSRYLNYNRNIETRDSGFYHFIRIRERLSEGEIKPLQLVAEDIRSVLLNKRKIEYIQDLENTVYKEGKSRNQVEIY